jgi:hypothetical protein
VVGLRDLVNPPTDWPHPFSWKISIADVLKTVRAAVGC